MMPHGHSLLEILCLYRLPEGVKPAPERSKPFDVLVKGLAVETSRDAVSYTHLTLPTKA